MKNAHVRKLGLKSEVVRALTSTALAEVIGGMPKTKTIDPGITDFPPCRDVPTLSDNC